MRATRAPAQAKARKARCTVHLLDEVGPDRAHVGRGVYRILDVKAAEDHPGLHPDSDLDGARASSMIRINRLYQKQGSLPENAGRNRRNTSFLIQSDLRRPETSSHVSVAGLVRTPSTGSLLPPGVRPASRRWGQSP